MNIIEYKIYQMITNKLIKRTIRLYTELFRLCTKRRFSGDHEGKLETLSRMTNTPTIDDDFSSSLNPFFFLYCSNRMRTNNLEKRPNYFENAVGVNCRPAEIEKAREHKQGRKLGRGGATRVPLYLCPIL